MQKLCAGNWQKKPLNLFNTTTCHLNHINYQLSTLVGNKSLQDRKTFLQTTVANFVTRFKSGFFIFVLRCIINFIA